MREEVTDKRVVVGHEVVARRLAAVGHVRQSAILSHPINVVKKEVVV
jgi:hypothetical protein